MILSLMGSSATAPHLHAVLLEKSTEQKGKKGRKRRLTFPIEIQINALFKLIRDLLRFIRALEPSEVLFVKSPRLFLQF